MRSVRSAPLVRALAAWLTLTLIAPPAIAAGQSQTAMPIRALELEQDGKLREALVAYRAALSDSSLIPVVLGLERVYNLLGKSDSMLPLLDSLLGRHPRDPQLRGVQLRTYSMLHRDDEAAQAFERWLVVAPREATPFREYARLLLSESRSAATDTVLRRAERSLGSTREFAAELAQLRAALGLWEASAQHWREAVENAGYLENAAVFSLLPTPEAQRDPVREAFRVLPISVPARRTLALLELRWSSPRQGWLALRDLPPNEAAVNAWSDFAEQAEDASAWLTARDALVAAYAQSGVAKHALRAASDALTGNDPSSALEILGTMRSASDVDSVRDLLPVRVRALAALGRPAEAEAMVAAAGPRLDDAVRRRLARLIASGWVRAGNLANAKRALAQSGEIDDDRTVGWIALYEGDLRTARKALRRATETTGDLVLALSLLSRTTADSAPAIGRAFLALAQGDSGTAADAFVGAADSVVDAAPLLLNTAARLQAARGNEPRSVELWERVVGQYAAAPEAAEAELEWARVLRRSSNAAGAIQHLEHLILTYPQSALVPQARRELDLARASIPLT